MAYIRLKTLSIGEVFSFIEDSREFEFEGFPCSPLGDRIRTYHAHGVECVCCGMAGEYFAAERFADSKKYHLNFYGVKDGKEVMMTADHRIPRSKGGKNCLENYQPMCSPCNSRKGSKMIFTEGGVKSFTSSLT